MKPLNKKVLLLPIEIKDRTEGGLYIPEMAKERPGKGTIKVIADDCEYIKPEDVGEIVLYGKFAGTEIELDGNEAIDGNTEKVKYILINEKDLLGIL